MSVPSPIAPAPPLAGLSILIAEDDEVNRMMIEEMLEGEGARLTCVAGGRQAVARIEAGEGFDILLTDIQMPGLDGYATAQAAHRLMPSLPVVGFTGYDLAEQAVRRNEAGIVDCLAKPFDPDALIAMIRRHARRGGAKGEGIGERGTPIPASGGGEGSSPGGTPEGEADAPWTLPPETRGRLLREVSHDLNNVITTILGYADLAQLRAAPDDGGKLAEYLRQIVAAGERARDLVAKMRSTLPPAADGEWLRSGPRAEVADPAAKFAAAPLESSAVVADQCFRDDGIPCAAHLLPRS